ncbi:MAG TPA: antibiotic biosynthesis monooxygenase [Solirubrobacteraceae bacterium]|nr:antibiotic biosynthesis monooxygenase [Solirubrobacteraceae bacterium]
MIVEHASINVLPGEEQRFEQALAEAREVIAGAPGYRGLRALRGVESPHSYLLLIEWDTLEDHMVGFRESELFGRWRALIGPHFDGAPSVDHYRPLD